MHVIGVVSLALPAPIQPVPVASSRCAPSPFPVWHVTSLVSSTLHPNYSVQHFESRLALIGRSGHYSSLDERQETGPDAVGSNDLDYCG
ncbi:hypothetical protein B0T13DRAFT_472676 [Neurospora crassa]|nr:hypothetical protein B0T13DRAFT_472676 [Neurospora crassa]